MDELRGPVAGGEPLIRAIPLPNGARLAFTIQVALEAWAGADEKPDWTTISSQLYGPRTGMARLAGAIEEQGFRACVHISGLLAERWPELVAGLARNGHEIVGHGWAQDQPMAAMDEQEDLLVVRRCAEIIDEVTGQRPAGWSSHGSRRGDFTVLSLLKEGYLYTRDFRDADLPYVVAQLGDRRLLAMPRTDKINDLPVMHRHGHPPSVYVEYFKRAFDQLYAEGEKEPTVMTCVTHAYVSGKPWGASAVAECLKHVAGHDRVWMATGREVAEFYLAQLAGNPHPSPLPGGEGA
ncbi:MAG TPA: polysaccharide deacetylase family protein [Chloroflexota bacterium]